MNHLHDAEGRESPADPPPKDAVFIDSGDASRWLDHERSRGARESNYRRPKVGVFRWCKRLVVASVFFGLSVAVGLVATAWFSRTWLQKEGEKLLMFELAKRRIHLDYEAATYEFTRGLLLSGVTLWETETREKRLLTCSEMGFSFDAVGLVQNRLSGGLTTSFRARGATMVCYEDGEEVATIENLHTDIIGRPNDVLVERLSGRIGDLDIKLEGQILSTRESRLKRLAKERKADEAGKPKTKKVADFAFFKSIVPWLAVKSREEGVHPEIRATFVIDHAAAASVTVSGRFSGRHFDWKKVPLDSAAIDFSFAEGDERLVLPSFNLVYHGGLITGSGVWDSGTNIAQIDRLHSTAHLIGLVRDIHPEIATVAASIVQDEPPLITARGQMKIKDFWNSDLEVTYRHQSGMTLNLGGRPLRVEGINGRLRVADGGIQTESLRATVLGGALEFAGRGHFSGGATGYSGTLNVSGMPMQAIVTHFGGTQVLPGIVSGRFEGSGGNSLAQLNGKGTVRIDAAKLYKVPVVGPVQSLMGSVVPVFGDAEKRSELTASFTVADGLLDTRDLTILADGTRVEVGGTLNLTNWQTQFEARGNLVGALGLLTGLLSKALVVEGSGRVDNLDLKLKHVPAEFASETVKGIFGVAKEGVGVVSNTVGAGIEGAQEVAGGAIKATGNVLNGGAEAVTDGVRAVGGGIEDGARMVGKGAKRIGEGLMKIIPGGEKKAGPEKLGPPDPEPIRADPVATPMIRD